MSSTKTRVGGRVPSAARPYPDIHETAEALGLGLTVDHHLSECPACGAAGHGSASVFDGAKRWKCHRCEEHGTAYDLVAFEHHGASFSALDAAQQDEVMMWFDEEHISVSAAGPPVSVDPSAVRAPYRSQVTALWRAAPSVITDPSVREWLRRRGLSAGHLVDLDLARALPDETDAVSWAEGWRAGHRLLLPVYGPNGELEALRARWVHIAKPRGARPCRRRTGAREQ